VRPSVVSPDSDAERVAGCMSFWCLAVLYSSRLDKEISLAVVFLSGA